MEWMMILTAMSLTSPNDKPAGIVKLEFETQEQCEHAASSMTYTLDLGMFVDEKDWTVKAECQKKSLLSQITSQIK